MIIGSVTTLTDLHDRQLQKEARSGQMLRPEEALDRGTWAWPCALTTSPWRNRLARLTVNQEVGSSSLPGDVFLPYHELQRR